VAAPVLFVWVPDAPRASADRGAARKVARAIPPRAGHGRFGRKLRADLGFIADATDLRPWSNAVSREPAV